MAVVAIASLLNDSNFGVFRQDSASIEGLVGVVDLYPEESHSYTLSTTDYPIETGATLTDHAYIEPATLNFKAMVSNFLPIAGGLVSIDTRSRARDAYQRMKALMDAREPVRVVTLIDTYENMLITGLYPKLDVSTGRALILDITLREVIFAQTEIVALPAAQLAPGVANNSSPVNGGTKQSPQTQSTLLNDALGGLFP